MKKHKKEILFTASLLKWHRYFNKREMPWAGEKDPYKIWLSEVILQQTRVDQGLQYYNRFVNQYPDVLALAQAPDNEVFKLWEGLGYYSRCKNLLYSARYIATVLRGKFPSTYEDIRLLKGVGPYTAAAIASFAYNLPYAVVDGNVNRVLARYFGLDTPIDSNAGKLLFAQLATQLLDIQKAGVYNQAIMDFGATVCKPQLPLCANCPLQDHCVAYLEGRVQELPFKEKKIKKVHRWFYYIVAESRERVLVNKRTGKDIWQSLHEFVLIEANDHADRQALLQHEAFRDVATHGYTIISESKVYKQQLTHQTIHAIFIRIKTNRSPAPEGMQWVAKKELVKLAFPRLINSFLEGEYACKALPG